VAKQFQNVRGMPDILPEEQYQIDRLTDTFRQLADAAGYLRMDSPILEEKGVFIRGVGSGTDIIDKEMYDFEDRSGNLVALRPEPTAGVVRAYIQNGMGSWPQPVKLQIDGPMFRYDRPQAGRRRQFHQLGVEMIGDASPSQDAHIITLALRFYRMVGLRGVTLHINSIGSSADRKAYLKDLATYLKEHRAKLPELDQKRITTNPLRVIDSKASATQKVIAGAPQIRNYLSEASKAHFASVLEYLDTLGIAYELNPFLVRGLDYYTDTVFEFYGVREGAQSSLGGGGRYNHLVEQLGGMPTPAAGFGIGIERLMLELAADGVTQPTSQPVPVYVASLGEPARLAAFSLIERLLDAGVGAVGAVDKDSIGAQLERANKLGVPHAVIIGQKEVQEETAILRDMKSGAQEMLPLKSIVRDLQHRFSSPDITT